jgi:MFS family permease
MVPLTVGFLISGPLAGRLADRYGPRNFATVGMVLTGLSLLGLTMIPMNFKYPDFAILVLMIGFSMGLFAAPNTSAVMNSLPAAQRGAGSGMLNTLQNSAVVLSMGFFFTIITIGLAATLPQALLHGLTAQGVPLAAAQAASHVPPIGSLFAAFLGVNPITTILPASVLATPGVHAAVLTGHGFFPNLIAGPFAHGLREAFGLAALICFLGAVFSWMRGPGQSEVHHTLSEDIEEGLAGVAEIAMSEVGVGSPGEVMEPSTEPRTEDRVTKLK